MEIGTPHVVATPEPIAELDRLGDEIAELSAHLEAATAHLLEVGVVCRRSTALHRPRALLPNVSRSHQAPSAE